MMDGILTKKYTSIVVIDVKKNISYKLNQNEIIPTSTLKYNKKSFYICAISLKHLITDTIKINRNISQEDIKNAIEIKVYDELNLDPTVEYKICYQEIVNDKTEQRKYNIFAIKTKKLISIYSGILARSKYIDAILPEPLIFVSLYSNSVISKNSVDCFVYFEKNDAFLTVYQKGRYIYSKSLNLTIEQMYNKFFSKILEFDKFLEVLFYKNIFDDNIDIILENLYSEIFEYINDILFYVKRAFKIDNIDRIYIFSPFGTFCKIDTYIQKNLDFSYEKLDIKYPGLKNENLHHYLTALTYKDIVQKDINCSIFKKELSFLKKASGKLTMIVFLALSLSFFYPVYRMIQIYDLKQEIKVLKYKMDNTKNLEKSLNDKIEKFLQKKHKLKNKIKEEYKELNLKRELFKKVYDHKVYYLMKINIIADLFKKIDESMVKIYDFCLNSKRYNLVDINISIYSKSYQNITNLVKRLSNTNGYIVKLKEIRKDDVKKRYISNVEIRVDK